MYSMDRVTPSPSGPLINVASVAHIVQVDALLIQVEFVKYSEVPDSELEFRTTLKPLMGKVLKPCAHFIHLSLNGVPDRCRE